MQSEVTAFAEECGRELAAAEPVIAEAEAALNSLDKGSLGELKSFGSPAAEVVQVVSACIVLTAPGGKIPKVSSLPPAVNVEHARGHWVHSVTLGTSVICQSMLKALSCSACQNTHDP